MKELVRKIARRKPDLIGKENYLVSAVLLPLVEHERETEILFEVRSLQLERQPGEICFPGGRVEAAELADPSRAALREAAEELGLCQADFQLLAPLDFLVTPMGTIIYPYVGRVLHPERIVPNSKEVDSVFAVPLSYLLAYKPGVSYVDVATRYGDDFPLHRVPARYRGGWQKRWSYPTYIYEYKDYFIWGMTAIILHHFLSRLLR